MINRKCIGPANRPLRFSHTLANTSFIILTVSLSRERKPFAEDATRTKDHDIKMPALGGQAENIL